MHINKYINDLNVGIVYKSVCILIKKHQIIRILLIHIIIYLKKFSLDCGHQHHQLVKLDKLSASLILQAGDAGDHNPAKISSNKLLYVLREFVLFDVSL